MIAFAPTHQLITSPAARHGAACINAPSAMQHRPSTHPQRVHRDQTPRLETPPDYRTLGRRHARWPKAVGVAATAQPKSP